MLSAFLILLACTAGDPGPATAPPVPGPPTHAPVSRSLEIALAGAPVELFGPADSPSFGPAFATLAAAGIDTFFPLFLTSEVDGVATTTGHLTHFLSPTALGSGDPLTCRGATDPYAQAEGQIGILFPGFLLMGDPLMPIDEPEFRALLAAQDEDCWSDHPGVVTAFDTYDEPALYNAVAGFLGEPALRIDNIAIARAIVDEELALPTVLIEGPGPLLFAEAGLTGTDLTTATDIFWGDLEPAANEVDCFGFDVYPVPDHPLSLPGDYVQQARDLSPATRAISVLQGFGYGQTTGGVRPGRAPTLEETRFMAFDSVAAGADLILWYGQSALLLSEPDQAALWQSILTVSAELHDIRDALTGTPTLLGETPGFRLRAHRQPDGSILGVATRTSGDSGELCRTMENPAVHATASIGPAPHLEGDRFCLDLEGWEISVFAIR